MSGVIEAPAHRWTIEHVTLPRGKSEVTARSEAAADLVKRLNDNVLPALAAGEAVAVPGHPGYRLAPIAAVDGAFWVHLESAAGVELLTIVIGWNDPGAGVIWQAIAGAVAEPRRPWVANRLELAGLTGLGAEGVNIAIWSAELARCLAWARVPDRDESARTSKHASGRVRPRPDRGTSDLLPTGAGRPSRRS